MKIYLAIPYSWNPEKSFEVANKVSAKLIGEGHIVYSPISLAHPVQQHMKETNTRDTWMRQDLCFIEWCEEIYVVVIGQNGMVLIWESTGVQTELEHAKKHKKPVKIIEWIENSP